MILITFDQFITKYLGKPINFDNLYGPQCVDSARQYIKKVLGLPQPKGVVGAKDFWTNYETDPALRDHYQKITNTLWAIPRKGDILIWGAGAGKGLGHIAIYISGNILYFTSFDQNWNKQVGEKINHNYLAPKLLGWFRPNVSK